MKMPNSTRRRQQHGIISISVEKSLLGATSALIQFMTLIVPRKLKSIWFGPFTVNNVLLDRGVEVAHPKKGIFKVNGQKLKPYFRRRVQKQQSISHP